MLTTKLSANDFKAAIQVPNTADFDQIATLYLSHLDYNLQGDEDEMPPATYYVDQGLCVILGKVINRNQQLGWCSLNPIDLYSCYSTAAPIFFTKSKLTNYTVKITVCGSYFGCDNQIHPNTIGEDRKKLQWCKQHAQPLGTTTLMVWHQTELSEYPRAIRKLSKLFNRCVSQFAQQHVEQITPRMLDVIRTSGDLNSCRKWISM